MDWGFNWTNEMVKDWELEVCRVLMKRGSLLVGLESKNPRHGRRMDRGRTGRAAVFLPNRTLPLDGLGQIAQGLESENLIEVGKVKGRGKEV